MGIPRRTRAKALLQQGYGGLSFQKKPLILAVSSELPRPKKKETGSSASRPMQPHHNTGGVRVEIRLLSHVRDMEGRGGAKP